jgi:NodT family efflux transporter outer membrane factor (OMF) lipoprotein
MKWLTLSTVGFLAVVLAGCAVGPDFQTPPPPVVGSYTASPLPGQTVESPTGGGAAQQLDFTKQLSAQWWKMFSSPELDALIAQGLTKNPSLAAAEAAVNEAKENLRAASGVLLFPSVDANFAGLREKVSGQPFSPVNPTLNVLSASVNVSYTLDLFGGSRRQLEALAAQVDYQRFQYEAAYLTLTANLVTTAIQNASLNAQIAATNEIIAAEEQQMQLVQRQYQLGAVPQSTVLALQSELARTKATLPALIKQQAFTRHALSALSGRLPGEGGLPDFTLDALHLPQMLPVGLPSALVQQRPDIQASQALFHQAAAGVGVATANLYPQITLTGGYGAQSSSVDTLFNRENTVWNLGAGVLQPLFHGGELQAKRRAALEAYNQAAAQYQQTVLQAFQNVADALRALDTDALSLKAQSEAEAAARASLDLVRRQFQLGAVSHLNLLVAERDYQQQVIALITARAQRYADTATLFQALGGGWWNRVPAAGKDADTVENMN